MKDAIEAPTITTLEREIGAGGTELILAVLLAEIEKANRMLNVNDKLKLTHEQCCDIAILMLEEFPHESLEDFALAMRRGITGRYDDKLLRLDVQIIFRWVRCFLDEKTQRSETIHKEQSQEELRPYTPEEKARISKIINESWVGSAIKESETKEADYQRYRAELLLKRKKDQENATDQTKKP